MSVPKVAPLCVPHVFLVQPDEPDAGSARVRLTSTQLSTLGASFGEPVRVRISLQESQQDKAEANLESKGVVGRV